MIRKFHLYPNDRAEVVVRVEHTMYGKDPPFNFTILGAYKSDHPNSDGNVYWEEGHAIRIVRARRPHVCYSCKKEMGKYGRMPKKKISDSGWGMKPFYYIGFITGMCTPPYWGYELPLCPKCAVKVLGDHFVYPCLGWSKCHDVSGYLPSDHEFNLPPKTKTFMDYIEEQFTVMRM